jgi:hypothetical protein
MVKLVAEAVSTAIETAQPTSYVEGDVPFKK